MRWSIPRREWTHSHRGIGAHPHTHEDELNLSLLNTDPIPVSIHVIVYLWSHYHYVMYNVLSVLAIFIDVMDLLASSWSPSVIWWTKWFLKSWKTRMWTFFLLIDGTNYETSKNNCKKTLIKPPSPPDAGPPPVWKIILRTTPFIFI